ncbi:MAG: undecaprenyl/decaprenyl-phosphate alpha-N-acetylglucosaminyl 1-phosphate transferase [Nitrospira sp.]|nr:MAG: undecaprenyl/decaprenyl-phosphate alpha-N-acetylglucosaminyl 1-phosphate transferase [Nitrospira sp.]
MFRTEVEQVMDTSLFFSFMGSLIICMALIPALTASAGRLQFVDVPRERHAHDAPIAKIGGIAFGIATIAAVLLWAPKDQLILSSLLGGAVIVLFGAWDDRVNLTPRMKFIGQVLAAAIVIGLAGVRLTTVPFVDDVVFPAWVAIPLTLVVIVGVTNAVNLADGLDGLAGGLSLISFAGIAYLAYQADEPLLVLLMVSVLGGLLGFLRFNTYPAKIFMGDAGSQFLGHYLAMAAILLTGSARTMYSPLLALFIWGVPLLDTIGVMGQRLLEGRSPFVGDRNHIHHKLLAKGLTHGQAVSVIYLIHAVMVSCAYVLRWQSDVVLIVVYLLWAAIILSMFVPWTQKASSAIALADTSRSVPANHRALTLPIGEWAFKALQLTVPLYLVASVAMPKTIPSDAGLIAAALLVAVVGSMVMGRGKAWVVRVGLYVGSTCLLYYGEVSPRLSGADLMTPLNVGFVLLAGLVVLTIRFAGTDRFQMTPLDYLIVLLAVVMPFLPGLNVGEVPVSLLAAKLIVLFFSFELLLHFYSSAATRLGWVSAWMLGGLVLRAWWW